MNVTAVQRQSIVRNFFIFFPKKFWKRCVFSIWTFFCKIFQRTFFVWNFSLYDRQKVTLSTKTMKNSLWISSYKFLLNPWTTHAKTITQYSRPFPMNKNSGQGNVMCDAKLFQLVWSNWNVISKSWWFVSSTV